MEKSEVLRQLRSTGLRLAFDTSAFHADRPFFKICDLVADLNNFRSQDDPIQLIICAVAHAEKLFDLKQAKKALFDEAAVMKILERRGVRILPFDLPHARRLAELLGTRYPDTAAWQAAKLRRYIEKLGITHLADQVPGTGRSCSATVDWLIASHALEEQCLLVTEDTGVEFRDVVNRVKIASLTQALTEHLAEEQARASAA